MPYGFDYLTYHFQGLEYISLYDNSLSTHKNAFVNDLFTLHFFASARRIIIITCEDFEPPK